jgi:hypothetical protein
VQIKKSNDLDNACAKSLVLQILLAQAIAMQSISAPCFRRGWKRERRQERTLFAVACMPMLGAGSGTGHRLAAPSVRRPFETSMDPFVWEYLSFASLARSLI